MRTHAVPTLAAELVQRACEHYVHEFQSACTFPAFGIAVERLDGALALFEGPMVRALRAQIQQLRRCRTSGNAASLLGMVHLAIALAMRPASLH